MFLNGPMPMATIYLSMNMQRDSSSSICKVFIHIRSMEVLYLPRNSYDLCTLCSIGEAESGLERLHQCAEKELQVYLEAEGPSNDFNEFHTKLAGLTRYFFVELCKVVLDE